MKLIYRLFVCLFLTVHFSGCGYTQKNVLPKGIESIYVDTVKNKIPIQEVYVYVPGLEMDITNAVIRRLQVDGNLVVKTREEADAILEIDLVRFEQEGLRFTSLESVEEFRMFLVVDMLLSEASSGKKIWKEEGFSGDAEYYVSDVTSVNREEASRRSVSRLAKNIVDRIVEDW